MSHSLKFNWFNFLKLETQNYWNSADTFVKEVTAGRDESHGYQHMKTVAEDTLRILHLTDPALLQDPTKVKVASLAAWLHDIYDYKYDMDGTLQEKCNLFLKGITTEEEYLMINKIIDHISYSKEVKASPPWNWEEIFGDYAVIRHAVSDADKCQAIGLIGLERCQEYGRHYYREKEGKEISQEELLQRVVKHSEEKLLRLNDEFIHTSGGKIVAQPLHKEYVKALQDYQRLGRC